MKIQSLKCSVKALCPAWENLHWDPTKCQVRLQEPPAAKSRVYTGEHLLIDQGVPSHARNQVLSMMALPVDPWTIKQAEDQVWILEGWR